MDLDERRVRLYEAGKLRRANGIGVAEDLGIGVCPGEVDGRLAVRGEDVDQTLLHGGQQQRRCGDEQQQDDERPTAGTGQCVAGEERQRRDEHQHVVRLFRDQDERMPRGDEERKDEQQSGCPPDEEKHRVVVAARLPPAAQPPEQDRRQSQVEDDPGVIDAAEEIDEVVAGGDMEGIGGRRRCPVDARVAGAHRFDEEEEVAAEEAEEKTVGNDHQAAGRGHRQPAPVPAADEQRVGGKDGEVDDGVWLDPEAASRRQAGDDETPAVPGALAVPEEEETGGDHQCQRRVGHQASGIVCV